jgi:adenylylsulfate kinase-like enzyme
VLELLDAIDDRVARVERRLDREDRALEMLDGEQIRELRPRVDLGRGNGRRVDRGGRPRKLAYRLRR